MGLLPDSLHKRKLWKLNGVVIPVCSNQIMPIPRPHHGCVIQTIGEASRGPKSQHSKSRAVRGNPAPACSGRIPLPDCSLHRRKIQRVARSKVNRKSIGNFPVVIDEELSDVRALFSFCRWISILNALTCPKRSDATAFPLSQARICSFL